MEFKRIIDKFTYACQLVIIANNLPLTMIIFMATLVFITDNKKIKKLTYSFLFDDNKLND